MKSEPSRILVVDDDPAHRALAQVVLEHAGYFVYAAPDAATAYNIVRNHRVDLALIDLMLTDRSGLELAKDLHALPNGASVPLVAMSTHTDALDDIRTATQFTGFVAKPLDSEELIRTARQLLPPTAGSDPGVGAGRTVLMVDDDPVLRRLLSLQLAHIGFRVEVAATAQQALVICYDRPPDAVVTDALMPGMDGFELCVAIRTNPALALIPIVMVSSHYVEPEDAELARQLGATAYVTRSTEGSDVVRTVVESFSIAATTPVVVSSADLKHATMSHWLRVSHQLERQTRLNAALRARVDFQQRLLSVNAIVAESMSLSLDPAAMIGRALAPILSARGWRGAVCYLYSSSGEIETVVPVGKLAPATIDALAARPDLRETALSKRELVVRPTTLDPDPRDTALLATLQSPMLIAIPLVDDQGSRLGAVVLLTELVESSPEVFAFLRTLRHTLTNALSRLATEARYLHAQKLDAIGSLAGGIAHDFNNILAAIGLFTTLIDRALPDSSDVREDVDEVAKLVERGANLTRQLLAFSRKQVLAPSLVQPDELVKGIAGMLERLLGSNIEVVLELESDPAHILIDRGQFEQVIVNLAVNARDAMKSGGRLVIRTHRATLAARSMLVGPEGAAGDYVVLTVSDTGTGMSAATLTHIFEPFFTTKAPGEGTGLGLATVYGIVKQSQGHITVDSQPEISTTIRIVFPEVAAPVSDVTAPTRLDAGARKATILLVEDERQVRVALVRVLTNSGYHVLSAGTGAEALDRVAEATRIDLLITDIMLPGIDGVTLSVELRAKLPELPIVYISGHHRADAFGDKRLTHSEFLFKPFDSARLLEVVSQLLDDATTRAVR